MVLFVGLAEELLFRGIIQTDLQRIFGKLPGLLSASYLFGIMHLTWRLLTLSLSRAYSNGGMEEIINCENGVLVEPAGERELCEKIVLLLESEEMRSDIGEKASETEKEYEKLTAKL